MTPLQPGRPRLIQRSAGVSLTPAGVKAALYGRTTRGCGAIDANTWYNIDGGVYTPESVSQHLISFCFSSTIGFPARFPFQLPRLNRLLPLLPRLLPPIRQKPFLTPPHLNYCFLPSTSCSPPHLQPGGPRAAKSRRTPTGGGTDTLLCDASRMGEVCFAAVIIVGTLVQ